MELSDGDDWSEDSDSAAANAGGEGASTQNDAGWASEPTRLTAEDQLALARAPRISTASQIPLRGAQQPDPSPRAVAAAPSSPEPYRRGADGKLHAAPGRTITGPFDVGRWSHNIDWGGVARDLAWIGSHALALAGAPGLASKMGVTGVTGAGLSGSDAATLGAGLYGTGDDTLETLSPPRPKPRHW